MNVRILLLAVALGSGAIGRHHLLTVRPTVGGASAFASVPLTLETWHSGGDLPFDPSIERVLAADRYVNRAYVGPNGQNVGLYVGYYQTQRQGSAIHSPLNCLPGAGWQLVARNTVRLGTAGDDPMVNRVIIEKGDAQQLVYYWYQSRNRIVASEDRSKFYLVADAITQRRTDAALVRVITPIGGTPEDVDSDTGARTFARLALSSVNQAFFQ